MALTAGTKLGPYDIQSLPGPGGTGPQRRQAPNLNFSSRKHDGCKELRLYRIAVQQSGEHLAKFLSSQDLFERTGLFA